MLTPVKVCAIALMLLQVFLLTEYPVQIAIVMCALAAMFWCVSISVRQLLLRNSVIAAFAATFAGFAVVSGLISQTLDFRRIIEIVAKILLTFNCLYLGGLWLGREGLMRIVNAMPSERLRLYCVLFYRTAGIFVRAHGRILNQLRSRLDFTFRNRLLIARYYMQNLMFKELYAYHHYQSALYSRVHGTPSLHVDARKPSLHDITAIVIIIAGFIAGRIA